MFIDNVVADHSFVCCVDGFSNVIRIDSDTENVNGPKTFIRFDSFDKMKAWMLDMQNESQNMALNDDEVLDWWTALYQDVEPIEAKHQPKRGAIGVEQDTGIDYCVPK